MKEAINYLDKNNPVDAVIASAQLDDATVEDSIKFFLSKHPQVPIISIIPYEGSPLQMKCLDLGSMNTIPKPIQPAQLLRALSPHMA